MEIQASDACGVEHGACVPRAGDGAEARDLDGPSIVETASHRAADDDDGAKLLAACGADGEEATLWRLVVAMVLPYEGARFLEPDGA